MRSSPPDSALPVAGLAALDDMAELAIEAWLLAFASAEVIWLRLGRLAALDAAAMAEGERMVAEKAQAACDLPWQWLTGALGVAPPTVARRSVAYYRSRVGANQVRLSRPPRCGS